MEEQLAGLDYSGVSRWSYQDKEIILIPTAHVSKNSVELVKQVIAEEQPDSICVELDEQRYQTLQDPEAWKKTDIVKVIKSKRVGFLLANLVLSSYQKRVAKQLDTAVGQEMIQGIECAHAMDKNLVLADRSIQTTFLRIWRKLNLWEKANLMFNLIFSFEDEQEEISAETVEDMMQEDVLEAALAGIHQEFPKIGDILINERDQHLAHEIKNAPGPKVVAILGAAHVPGVSEEIYKEQNMEEINHVPQKKSVGKIFAWAIPAIIIGLIIYAFVQNIGTGLQQVGTWVVWNSGLAALFTLLALGHPLTILTSLVAAPFTSLNPLIACGWLAGLVEAALRKPTVEDLQNISDDIFSFKGFFTNRVLRIILIVIMANIGSSIGTLVAGLEIVQNLLR